MQADVADRRRSGRGAGADPPPDDEGQKPKRPNRTGSPLSIWVPNELRAALDSYIEEQDVPPDLTAVVRRAIEDFLRLRKRWPPPPSAPDSD